MRTEQSGFIKVESHIVDSQYPFILNISADPWSEDCGVLQSETLGLDVVSPSLIRSLH